MRKQVIRSHGNAMHSHPPVFPYSQCQQHYFLFDGRAYNVVSAPSSVFKEAILATSPSWPTGSAPDAEKLLKCKEFDLPARWWLLCMLGLAKCPMRLYASKEMAEKVIAVSV